jgi:hypothetical protein
MQVMSKGRHLPPLPKAAGACEHPKREALYTRRNPLRDGGRRIRTSGGRTVSQPRVGGRTAFQLHFGRTVSQLHVGRIRVADTGLTFGSVFIAFAGFSDASTFEQVDDGDER